MVSLEPIILSIFQHIYSLYQNTKNSHKYIMLPLQFSANMSAKILKFDFSAL